MNTSARLFGVAAALLVSLFALSMLAVAAPDATHQYIGASKCKMCHNSDKSGKQFDKWKDSKHSKAFDVLATPAALEAGKKSGVTEPQKDPKCLKCHVTGYGAPATQLGEKYDAKEGVTCEACHGAGGDYWKKETMEKCRKKEIDGTTVGLVAKPTEDACKKCHNPESPSYKEFKFDEYHSKIVHLIPKP